MMHTEETLNGQNDPQASAEPVNINADENAPGDQHLSGPVAEESELEALKAKLDEKNDQYLRLAAEFDNFKRRTAKERVEQMQTAGRDVIVALLEVLDDCERAERVLEKADDVAQIKEGIVLVFNKLRNTLGNRGLKTMESKGLVFDADLHEAVAEISAGSEMAGKVVDELTKGYYLNEKIIRFAKVVVGK